MMGGSFGHRLEDDVVRQAVQVAMEYKGTPIKLTYRREEDMMHDYTRQIAMARASGRVENGQVSAMDSGNCHAISCRITNVASGHFIAWARCGYRDRCVGTALRCSKLSRHGVSRETLGPA